MLAKLPSLVDKYERLTSKLGSQEVASDPKAFMALSKELAELTPIVEAFNKHQGIVQELEDSRELLGEDDPEMVEMAKAEIKDLDAQREALEEEIRRLLLPKDPNDEKNVILEIRAGTGGEEASLFANDLFRMYSKYSEGRRWKIDVLSLSESSSGGLKEVICLLEGTRVYSRLKFESGVHRVQRVPSTESQGRIHTSAATVAILPEAEDVDVNIEDKDLRIDVFRASGPGGQSVNTTDSAVRVTHIPSGLVVSCQDEKSQHKNRAKALKILQARLLEKMQAEAHALVAADRKAMVGSGDRSERIRTYNFPQGRITDHRIGLTLYQLDAVIAGDLDPVIDPLATHYEAEALKAEQANDGS